LEPSAADDADTAARLKELLILHAAISAPKPDEKAIANAADAFVAGDDNSKYHRQLYASSLLLNNKVAVDKALEYAEAAVGNSDNALTVPHSGSYVMASELYDSRQLALSRSEFVHVPDIPKPTLAAILRGRIEDLIGWALVQQNKSTDAEIHFKRALSILPEKSAWWRASLWRYGTALQANGKEAEALDAYIRSYSVDKPDLGRYSTVEALYKKLNGSDEGLEAKIGTSPMPGSEVVAKIEATAMPAALPAVTATPNIDQPQPTPTPATLPEPNPSPASEEAKPDGREPKTAARIRIEPVGPKTVLTGKADSSESQLLPRSESSKPNSVTKTDLETKPSPEPTAAPIPTPEVKPTPVAEASPSPTPIADATISPSPTPVTTVDTVPEAKPTVKPEDTPVKTEPTPLPSPTPITEAVPTPTPIATPSPEPVATPISTPTPEAIPSPSG